MVLKKAAAWRSLDNITVLILGFKGFERAVHKMATEGVSLQQVREHNHIQNSKGLAGAYNIIDDYEIIPEDFGYFPTATNNTNTTTSLPTTSTNNNSSSMTPLLNNNNTLISIGNNSGRPLINSPPLSVTPSGI